MLHNLADTWKGPDGEYLRFANNVKLIDCDGKLEKTADSS